MTDEKLRKSQLQTDAKFDQIGNQTVATNALFAKTDAKLAQMSEQIIATNAQLAKTDAKLDAKFAQMSEQIIATNAQLAKTDAKLAQMSEQIIATNAQLAKTDVQLANTDAQLAKTDAQLAKTDAQLAKTDAQLAKNDARLRKRIHELFDMYGGVSAHLGDEAELDFFVALNSNPQVADIHFDDVDFDLVRKKGNEKVQIDLFLFNKNSVAIIEVKRHLQSKHLDDLYNRVIPRFKRLFPEYKDKKLYAGLATYSIPKKAKPYVEKRIDKYGFFLLTPNRDHTKINVDAHAMRTISV